MVMVTDFLSVVQSPRFENLCRCKQGIRKCDSLLLFRFSEGGKFVMVAAPIVDECVHG